MTPRTFRSQRIPISHRSPEVVWRAETPFGSARLVHAHTPWRATASGDGMPTAVLVADPDLHRGAAWVAPEGIFGFPMGLSVDGVEGEVTEPFGSRFGLRLTRRSRTLLARVGDTEWTMRASGISSVELARHGAPVVTSGAMFTTHRLADGCTPRDLAVAIALSPLRTSLFVLTSIA